MQPTFWDDTAIAASGATNAALPDHARAAAATASLINKMPSFIQGSNNNSKLVSDPCIGFIAKCLENNVKIPDIKKQLMDIYSEEILRETTKLTKSLLKKDCRAMRKIVQKKQSPVTLKLHVVCKQLIDMVKQLRNDPLVKFAHYNLVETPADNLVTDANKINSNIGSVNIINTEKCSKNNSVKIKNSDNFYDDALRQLELFLKGPNNKMKSNLLSGNNNQVELDKVFTSTKCLAMENSLLDIHKPEKNVPK